MSFLLKAACLSRTGLVRKNNEDNFYFDGKVMEPDNRGLRHPAYMEQVLQNGTLLAVFDGMGGESHGELAAFSAARAMQQAERELSDYLIPERIYLTRICAKTNAAVVHSQQEQNTPHMGTTVSALYLTSQYAYACNMGDSRAYRLRMGEFIRISHDHVAELEDGEARKAPLTSFLGLEPEDVAPDPFIAKGKLAAGDKYLICSDGLTDLLSNMEIADIMDLSGDVQDCALKLVNAALKKGGRDNVTVIVCFIE